MLDRYVTIDRLAVGGMGEVFLARQEGAGGFRRTVVLKRLLPDAEGNDEAVGRLLDEARIVAALAHENVVSIIEVGEPPRDANGSPSEPPFLALEYVHGENCGTLRVRSYKRGIEMPIVVVARIIADVARGLHHAHVAKDVSGKPLNIVHRDVAPKNILIRHDGVSKISDFGIAYAQDRLSHTATGNVAGTLTYMSPEQVAAKPVDGRSDQFALGVCFWELLAGRRLFKADTPVATVERILSEDIEPPSEHRREVPSALDDIALRMLSREPALRFADCAEVAGAIEHALPDASVTVGRAAVAVFLEQVMGQEMKARQERIEHGATHASRAAPGPGPRVDYSPTTTNSVTSSVDSVRKPRPPEDGDEDTRDLRIASTRAGGSTSTSATGAGVAAGAPLQAPSQSDALKGVARAGPRTMILRAAAVILAFAIGLGVAAALYWPREDPSIKATREVLVDALDFGDLLLREGLVVHAMNAGVPEAQADDVAAKLVALQRERLELLLAHWNKDEAARQRERAVLVAEERALVAKAKATIALIPDPKVRTFFMTKWTWDSSVPLRWVPPPSLQEIQRELLDGEDLSPRARAERWQIADRIARRANIDPQRVRALVEARVAEREATLEKFKRAPVAELKALEDRARALHHEGRDALIANMPQNVARAITAAVFAPVSESTEPDMWYDDEVSAD